MGHKIKNRAINGSNISEIRKIVNLHNSIYGDNRTINDWIWEYNRLYSTLFVFIVIQDKDRIIGSQGMLPIYLIIKGNKNLSGKSESSLLDPTYRGGTLFKDLYAFAISRCQEKTMHCIWGFTSAVKVWRYKLKFAVYENIIYESTLILNINKMNSMNGKSKKSIKKILTYITNLRGFLYSFIFKNRFNYLIKKKSMQYTFKHTYNSITDLQALYHRLEKKFPDLIYIEQSEKYISWRIYDNPNVKYKTFFLYQDNLLKGYCYLGDYKRNICTLTDFTFEDLEAGIYLLRYILNETRKEDYALIYYMGNIQNPLIRDVFKLLKKFGFIHKKSASAFILKQISVGDKKIVYDIRNWYFSALWTEGYTS